MGSTIKRGIVLTVIAAAATLASAGAAQAASYSSTYYSQSKCIAVQPGVQIPAWDEDWCLTVDGQQGIRKANLQPGVHVPPAVQPGVMP